MSQIRSNGQLSASFTLNRNSQYLAHVVSAILEQRNIRNFCDFSQSQFQVFYDRRNPGSKTRH